MKSIIIVLIGISIIAGIVFLNQGVGSSDVQYKSISSLPPPVVNPLFDEYFPTNFKINDLLGFRTSPTSIHDDFGQDADYILSSVVASDAVLFIEPSESKNTFVQYEVYKFKDNATATELLNVYRSNWNTQKLTYSGMDIWVWEGYLTQDSSLSPASVPIYWNENFQRAFVQTSNQQDDAIISKLKSDLYCSHGEMSVGEYFIMIDVHGPKDSVGTISQDIWAEALANINVVNVNIT